MIQLNSGTFTPAPAGTFQAVCCDIVDHGMVQSEYAGEVRSRHVIEIKWQIEKEMENGKPFIISRRFTASLHEKGKLKPFLEAWRGKKFTAEELRSFDIEKLIGANCMLGVVHDTGKNGQTYANVSGAMPFLSRYGEPMAVKDYVRVVDRPDYQPKQSQEYAPAGVASTIKAPEEAVVSAAAAVGGGSSFPVSQEDQECAF